MELTSQVRSAWVQQVQDYHVIWCAGCWNILVFATRMLWGRQGSRCAEDFKQGEEFNWFLRTKSQQFTSFKVDVWSVGIMFYQMLFGEVYPSLSCVFSVWLSAFRHKAFWRRHEPREDASGHVMQRAFFNCDIHASDIAGGHDAARCNCRLDISFEPQGSAAQPRVFIGCISLPSNCDCELLQVSQEAKDFIKRCLARVDQRPDVLSL